MGKISAPIERVIKRMEFHSNHASRILGGFKWVPFPMTEADGQKDFPTVRLWIPQLSEDYRPSNLAIGTLRLGLHVATERKLGMAVHMEALEKVLDALETTAADQATIDLGFNGTLRKPMSMAVGNVFALDISVNSEILLTLDLIPYERGRRR